KPMGDNLAQAREIRAVCERKQLIAAVNFQLRYASFVMAARRLIQSGLIGELYDMEVRLTTFTPWEIFPHVAAHPRLEILYHSIHYIDLIRSFLGNPAGITARTFRHPLKTFASTRSSILMEYGNTLRAVINTNHDHDFGPHNQESFIKWEGTKGAVKARMGLLLDYPRGVPDAFEFCIPGEPGERSGTGAPEWRTVQLEGTWFPDAFTGTMSDLMRYAEGSIQELPTGIDDVIHTMELVEKAYESN
ncbi:MAG TPA: Gfo/Idh/MocA family oxidoreductase, partial [Anseongella sp.]|nr:Gfo/Idh/MocA family oxidoreductase [Anseongella sp.]